MAGRPPGVESRSRTSAVRRSGPRSGRPGQKLLEFHLVDDPDADLLRLAELRAGLRADDEQSRLLRDRIGDRRARGSRRIAGLVTGHAGERPGYHDGLAVQRTAP